MTKRFKGATCAYCGNAGETADHVFARGFFPPTGRDGIPQVAACEPCNRAKSELEHYLLSVLPFGGRHHSSPQILTEFVPRRLAKNARLHRELASGHGGSAPNEGDPGDTALMTVPFDSDRYFAYFRFIARGLAAFHWGCQIPADYAVSAGIAVGEHEAILRSLFALNSQSYARDNLGNGLLLYEGQQAVDDANLTVWRFQVYGRMVFSNGADAADAICSDLWAITAKSPMVGLYAG